jgi:hypothetical protein
MNEFLRNFINKLFNCSIFFIVLRKKNLKMTNFCFFCNKLLFFLDYQIFNK